MKLIVILCLTAAVLGAAVDGTVVNQTTAQPQPGVPVTLLSMGSAGPEPVANVKSDAQGKFHFDQPSTGPQLLQAVHEGVTFNLMLQPGAPTSGLTFPIYNATSKPGTAKVTEDIVLLQPGASEMTVQEIIVFQNDGKLVYQDAANGTVRFFVSGSAASPARVTVTEPSGLPLDQSAEKTGQDNVYKIVYPIKPGQTRIDIGYSVPYTSPGAFSGRTLQKDTPMRLAVPQGVSLKGDGLQLLGQDPQSQASIYSVKSLDYKVELEGTGSMAAASSDQEDSGSSFSEILPRIYDNSYAILGLAFGILLLGFIMLYRRDAAPVPAPATPKPAAPRSKRRR